jgi:hypothetical protein
MSSKCACHSILDGNTIWYDLLDDDIKVGLPDDFVTIVHNTVRGLGLEWCGQLVCVRGNFRKKCHVRKSLAEELPQFPHVFIPDATGKVRLQSKAAQEKKMNLGSETFRCPVSDTEQTIVKTGLSVLLLELIANARNEAAGRGVVFHVFHISNGYVL